MEDQQSQTTKRKQDHLDLTSQAQISPDDRLKGLNYEPLFASHPLPGETSPCCFLGKQMKSPFWISSMTGGVGSAQKINQHLAQVAGEFGLGMGLGSIRSLLTSKTYFEDFNLRPILGSSVPFYANLGIAQIESSIRTKQLQKINDTVQELQTDGLIIHINVLQEWLQPEGDRLCCPPLETIQTFLEEAPYPVIAKEVGQGLGPQSLEALMKLPLAAIEFGAFGGTNFSRLELLRQSPSSFKQRFGDFARIGHSAEQMVQEVNRILQENPKAVNNFIISGGIKNVLHGYKLVKKCKGHSVIGRANSYLKAAQADYSELQNFVQNDLAEWAFANNFIHVE